VTKRSAQSGSQEKAVPHGRKYRGGKSHPLPLWNGILEHCEKIGPALWEFVWLLDKITVEKDGKGIVLGGAPVKIERIARDLDRSDRTVRSNLDRLQDEKYIERTRTPYGLTIRVCNSRKFGIWTKKEIGRKLPERSAENCRNKEDSARNTATADAVAVGSVGGFDSIVPSAAVPLLDRRHPPSAETSKSDDDDRERDNRHRLKEKALSRFQEKHPGEVEPHLLKLWLDLIEERAKRKIESANYFLRGLENEFKQREESEQTHIERTLPRTDLLAHCANSIALFEAAARKHPAIARALRKIAGTFQGCVSRACDAPGVPDLDALEKEIGPLDSEVFLLLKNEAGGELAQRTRREEESRLKTSAKKMTDEQLTSGEAQSFQTRILREFGLPRLSLYYMTATGTVH